MTLGLGLLPLALAAALPASAQMAAPAAMPVAAPAAAPAMPLLDPIFSDNAVLQRDRRVPLWGWGTPGSTVTVLMDRGPSLKTRCGVDGKWMALAGPFPAGGPHTLSVSGGGAAQPEMRSNILFGDVWLCSGQSNMGFNVGGSDNGAAEVAAANYPQIRLLGIPNVTANAPQSLVKAAWQVCSPQTAGGFSAVGYFFGRELNQKLHVPIGLINSSWGGTIAEAWVSSQALNRDVPEFKPTIDALSTVDTATPFARQMSEWWLKNDAGTAQGYANADFADENWKSVQVPGTWENSGVAEMANFDGAAWFRRVVEVPANLAGRDLTLHLGTVDDRDTTYWNGEEIGHGDLYSATRDYTIPAAKVRAGRNVIAVRVLDTGGGGGLVGPAEAMMLSASATEFVPLTGEWKMQAGKALADMSAAPVNPGSNPNVPTVLYNAMIAPLVPYGIKGAIWYQGESNAGRAAQYQRLLPSLVHDWRARFGSGDFPFYIVQLAGFMAPDDTPKNDGWPNLREAQNMTAQAVGHSGVALAIDIGNEKNIHPTNKQEVGRRLALQALAHDYGQNVVFQGPTLQSVTRRGDALALKFANTGGALTMKGDAEHVFAIAGADKQFAWATPKIEGDTVVLTSPTVKEPTDVRFGWSNLPRGFVYNQAGLPATPFRTDKY